MITRTDIKTLEAFMSPAVATGQIELDIVKEISSILLDSINSPKNAQAIEPEEYWSKKQVQELFSISRSTIYYWIKRGWITPLGIGRQMKFKKSEVLKARANNTQPSSPL